MSDIAGFAERIRAAAGAGTPLRLRGGGTKDFYGCEPEGEVLDLSGYAGIVDYDPTELVVTARCGTPLADLEAALAAKGQWLAFEPPHFGTGAEVGGTGADVGGTGATVGGTVAAGLSGPRRASAGAVRDFILGAKVMDGRGTVLDFGGRVMKNVAGYDASRLMAGALGTLGIVLEVSIKTLPRPPAEATLRFEMPEDRALESLNRWGAQPLPMSASVWHADVLTLRLSGAVAAVRAAREKLGGDLVDDPQAAEFWRGIREQTDPFFAGDAPLWRLSLPSVAPAVGLPGDAESEKRIRHLIEWSGGLRWMRTTADAATMRAVAARAGGHATLFRGGDRSEGVFHPLPDTMLRLHRKLKKQFDPAGILNRGRMYPGI